MTATTAPSAAFPGPSGAVRHQVRTLPPLAKAALGIAILVGGGLLVVRGLGRGQRSLARCVYACGPNVGPRMPETQSYVNRVYGFSFGYPDSWDPVRTSGTVVAHYQETASDNALISDFQVNAGSGRPDGAQMVSDQASLISQHVTNLQLTGTMPGAKIGFVAGTGAFYSAVFTTGLGSNYKVDIAIVFTRHNTTWVLVTAVSFLDSRGKGPGFEEFDDALTRWQWSSP